MLQILTCRCESALKSNILSQICKNAQDGKHSFLLVPEPCSHEAERELCRIGSAHINLFAEVLTFKRLASRIFGEVGGLADVILDNGGRMLMISRALKKCSGVLKFFPCDLKRANIISEIAALCAELKENGILPEDIAKAAQDDDFSSFSGKLSDISYIYSAYCAMTAEGTIDPSDINTRLAARVAHSEVISRHEIFLVGYSGFTPPEYSVISEMLRKTNVTVALAADLNYSDSWGLFEKERLTVSRLRRAAARAGAHVTVSSIDNAELPASQNALSYLANDFFTNNAAPFTSECSGIIALHTAGNEFSECEYVAANIRRLVREKGIRYRDIAVAARCPEQYLPLMQAIFEKYDVPAFLSVPSDILTKPLFSFVLHALEFLTDLSRGSFISMLKCGFFDLSNEQISLIEAYVEFWDITGTALISGGFTLNPYGYQRSFDAQSELQLAIINSAYEKITPFITDVSEDIEKCETINDFIKCIYNFCTELKIKDKLSSKIEYFTKTGQPQLAEQYAQMWNVFISALTQFNKICGKDTANISEFCELLRTLVCSYEIDIIPTSLDSVVFTGMDKMSFISRPYLFIVGAADGILPFSHRRAGILSEEERDSLISSGIPLGQSATELSDYELGIIYKSMTCPREYLSVSYPQRLCGGAELRPSFIFKRFEKLFPHCRRTNETSMAEEFKPEAFKPYFELACRGLSDRGDRRAVSAYNTVIKAPAFAQKLDLIRRKANISDAPVSSNALEFLCGGKLLLSPSKIERYSSCRFSYFMQYALGIKSTGKKAFDSPDIGNFTHFILESVLSEIYNSVDKLRDVSDEQLDRLLQSSIEKYEDLFFGEKHEQTARFSYLFSRLCRGVSFVVKNVISELERSSFTPIAFEQSLSNLNSSEYIISSGGKNVAVRGKPDRIDGYVRNGTLYIRVIDYKTGTKHFDLSDIRYGLNLQMLIYLFASIKNSALVKKMGCSGSASPAGILYVPAKEVFVSVSNSDAPEQYQSEMSKALSRSGLLLCDGDILSEMEHVNGSNPDFLPISFNKSGELSAKSSVVTASDFKLIENYINNILSNIISDMDCGKVNANPYSDAANQSVCDYCGYRSACLLDLSCTACSLRRLYPCEREKFLANLRSDTGSFS